MPITITCPNPYCLAKMTAPEGAAGKRARCRKCNTVITVPVAESNGIAAPTRPAEVSASATAAPALPTPVAPPPDVDLDAEAAALLAEAPDAVAKAPAVIEFTCPMCDEPIKMGVDLAGKRTPCPSCRRIIAVPIPKKLQKANWRDAAPALPAGARRDEPPPDALGNTGKAMGISDETRRAAGLIETKRKPLTLLQMARPYLLLGTPVVVLLACGLWLWHHFNTVSEKVAFDTALAIAAKEDVLDTDQVVAVHGLAGKYHLRKATPGCALKASEEYRKALAAAVAGQTTQAGDAFLGDLAVAQLDLSNDAPEQNNERKLPWKETQRILAATLGAIHTQPGRVSALRRIAAGLGAQEQSHRILPLTRQVYSSAGIDQAEALATVGLELLRLGKNDLAVEALKDAEAPYTGPTRPALRPAVVALAVALGRAPIEPKPAIDEQIASFSGRVNGLARLGKLDEARKVVVEAEKIDDKGGWLTVRVALVDGEATVGKVTPADVEAALAAVPLSAGVKERALNWVRLRLIELALAAEFPADRIAPAVAAINEPYLSAWGGMLLYRQRLNQSRAIEGEDGLEGLPAETLPGFMARFELARHNTLQNSGWGKAVYSWAEPAKAAGALGVALGMQGGK